MNDSLIMFRIVAEGQKRRYATMSFWGSLIASSCMLGTERFFPPQTADALGCPQWTFNRLIEMFQVLMLTCRDGGWHRRTGVWQLAFSQRRDGAWRLTSTLALALHAESK